MVDSISINDRMIFEHRLDNVRILKALNDYGFKYDELPSVTFDCDYNGPDISDGLLLDALTLIFDKADLFFMCDYTDNDNRIELIDYMDLSTEEAKIITDCEYECHVIAIKSDKVNEANYTSSDIWDNIDDPGGLIETEIMMVKNGFLFLFEFIYGTSYIIEGLLQLLEKDGHIKKGKPGEDDIPGVPEINIKITPDSAYVDMTLEGGVKQEKKVAPVDLLQAISRHSAVEEFHHPKNVKVKNEANILPHECGSISTVFTQTVQEIEFVPKFNIDSINYELKKLTEKTIYGILVPEGIYQYNYNGEINEIPFPQLLYVYTLEGTKLTGVRVFATEKGEIDENIILYRFPFGNSGHDGGICFGSNPLPSLRPRDLKSMHRFILALEHNDHYYALGSTKSQREVINEVKKSGKFDYNLLVKSNFTLQGILS